MTYNPRSPRSLLPQSLLKFPLASFDPFWEQEMQEIAERPFENTGLTVSEDKKSFYVEASMPGLNPENIEVTLEKGILWVRGEKQEEEKNEEKKFYRKATSSFSYRLALPNQIDEHKEPTCIYKDGILKLTFNKAPQAQAKKISVKSK